MIILTSGIEDFGFGFSEEEAILDAVQNASRPIVEEGGSTFWVDVTEDWIRAELDRKSDICGKGLYFMESDEDCEAQQ